jgi:hypothetical protein
VTNTVVVDGQIEIEKVNPKNDDVTNTVVVDGQIEEEKNLDLKTELIVKPVKLEDEPKKNEGDDHLKETEEKTDTADETIKVTDYQQVEKREQVENLLKPSKTKESGMETKNTSEQIKENNEKTEIANETKKDEDNGQVKEKTVVADDNILEGSNKED